MLFFEAKPEIQKKLLVFLAQIQTLTFAFEINWPLEIATQIIESYCKSKKCWAKDVLNNKQYQNIFDCYEKWIVK